MTDKFHTLLDRQFKKHCAQVKPEFIPEGFDKFLKDVDATYRHSDDDRVILERSIEISSQELLQRNSEIRAIFKAIPDIIIRIKANDGTVLDYKEDTSLKNYLDPKKVLNQKLFDIFSKDVSQYLERGVREALEQRSLSSVEYPHTINGNTYHFEARIQPLSEDELIIIIRNITERKLAEEQLRLAALYDKLTSLPNRALFFDRLSLLLERTHRHHEYLFAVLFLDLDRFKIINDSLGHLAGDQLLITIAGRLKKCLRDVDTVARLGGDEFTILLDDIRNIKDAVLVSQRIENVISAPIEIENKKISVTASIGITINSSLHQKPEDLLREADTAMYRAKTDGRARYEIFNKDMHITAISLLNLEADLKRALKENEFRLYYQPIISLKDKKILRMEALIRWIHPKRGIIPPIEFIPFAEETGLILSIGDWVLASACDQSRAWSKSGFKDVSVAVNFSALQFQRKNLPELVKQTVNKTKVKALTLEIEITETTAMKDTEFTVSTLKELKSMGIKISIDDFGVGYSSLSCLKTFPIDSLKIDRSFIRELPHSANNTAITNAIIGLAHNLDLQVCAEGIEMADQLEFLRKNHCDEGQGFLFSKPVPADEATRMLIKSHL